ncbi:MAG: Crp/Fnr family transcriptional regulator [Bacteroidales bacterium]|nr:Crp/Fnr family transcriptional regulator [Bacteroidales bacterium]MDZ4204576.1 Crp/Fnr family transcriptional regulator [Bacteroidales bacterium]
MQEKCVCDKCDLRSAFFKSFNKPESETFCNQKVEKNFSKGEIIIREGEQIRDFSYLKSGLVKLYKTTPSGKDQIILISEPFDFVSLLSVFSSSHYNYSVSVLEDSVICCLSMHDLKELALGNAIFTMNLMEKMSETTDKIIIESLAIRLRHLRGKVAYILLMFSDRIYNNTTFELPVSRREIAEYIGVTTENVIRSLSEFRKDKLIRINGKEIEIIDKETLEKISNYG